MNRPGSASSEDKHSLHKILFQRVLHLRDQPNLSPMVYNSTAVERSNAVERSHSADSTAFDRLWCQLTPFDRVV